MGKYCNIAKEVAKRTPMSTEQVLEQISRVVNTLIYFGYSEMSIDDKITINYVENIVMNRVKRGLY